jgi:hypothetical protein
MARAADSDRHNGRCGDSVGVLYGLQVWDATDDCVARCRVVEIFKGVATVQRSSTYPVLQPNGAVLWLMG